MAVELQFLKELADKLGFSYHHNIGPDKLYKQLDDYCIETLGYPLEAYIKGKDESSTEPEKTSQNANMSDSEVSKPVEQPKAKSDNSDVELLKNLTFSEAAKKGAEAHKQSMFKRAMKLVRCTISCNNPNKRNFQGDIFSARNASIDEVKKFIPFNTPTHVPAILLNMIKEKQLQTFYTEKVNGNQIKRVKLVPEYNVQELPPLTTEEYNAIRQKQLAEGGNN